MDQMTALTRRGFLKSAGVLQPDQKQSLPGHSKILSGIAQIGKWLLGKGDAGGSAESGDVTQPLRLTADEALHGGSRRITVQTDGKTQQLLLTIPPGMKSGTKLRLKGKGRPLPDGSRGDLYLRADID